MVVKYLRDRSDAPYRSQLLQLLCMDRPERGRAGELSVHSKSALLQTLMSMGLSCCDIAMDAARSLLLTTKGDDLSELKSTVDSFGDVNSMHKLVFQDVREDIRDRVLDHFLAEGSSQVAHRLLLDSPHFQRLLEHGRRRDRELLNQHGMDHKCVPGHLVRFFPRERGSRSGSVYDGRCGHSWLKIVFDVDDTLLCSGGHFPTGVDERLP